MKNAPSASPSPAVHPGAATLPLPPQPGPASAATGAVDPGHPPGQTLRPPADAEPGRTLPVGALSSASVTFPGSVPDMSGAPVASPAPTPGSTLPQPPGTIPGGVPAPSAGTSFRVLRTIGRGGMGVVYAAEQGSLKREVALKMVLPETEHRAFAEERFAAEAVVTGRLDHPNIVSVHDLGRDAAGSLFISMKLVRGLSWDRLLHPRDADPPEDRERAAKLGPRDHIDILLRVCDAVAFAHSHGIVHRDLKPENIMVGAFGEILVMDWGLAMDVSEEARRARLAGEDGGARGPAGTPRYMPPELTKGDPEEITFATDVYLLGGILYEILTGTPPHKGDTVFEVLHAAMKGRVEPARVRAPDRPISAPLEAIAARALEPESERRHQTVARFAQEVREFLRHEASLELSAAATAEIERQERVIRDPGVAPAEVYGALAAAIAELKQAEKLWSGNEAAREGLTRAHLAYAAAAVEREDLELAETELSKVAPATPQRAELARAIAAARTARALEARRRRLLLRGLAAALVIVASLGVVALLRAAEARERAEVERRTSARNLARLFHEMGHASLANVEVRTAEVLLARALMIDDRRDTREALLRARTAGAQLVWTSEVETGGPAIALSPDGALLAAVTTANAIALFETTTGRSHGTLGPLPTVARSVAFGPGARQLAAALEDGRVLVYDVASQRELWCFAAHTGRAWGVALSPDGRRLATCGEDRAVKLFDVERGTEVASATLHGATVYGVAYRPGGKELATASWDSAIRLWDAETLAPLREVRQEVGWVFRPVFSPDGKLVGAGNDQTTVNVNDADTGALVLTLRGHDRGVESLSWSPDGRRILTGSSDHTVRIWDVGSARVLLCMRARRTETQGTGVAWSPQGRYVALAGFDKRVTVWDLEGTREVATLRGHERAAAGVRFSPDGKSIASSAWDRTVRVWDVTSRKELRTIRAHEDQVEEIAWGVAGRRIASGGWDRTARVFDAATGQELRAFRGHESWIAAVDLSPDERLLASASEDGTLRLWDVETGAARHVCTGHTGGVLCVAVSPDGKRVASGGADHTVRVWDAATGAEVLKLDGHTADVEGVAWSPDGRRLATGSWDGTARVWDASDGRPLRTLEGHEGWVYGVRWSRDGRRLASASEDMTVRLWDVERGVEMLKLVGHTGEVQTCDINPEGTLVASASYDATVRLWDIGAIERFLATPAADLALEAERHTGLKVDSLDPLALPVTAKE